MNNSVDIQSLQFSRQIEYFAIFFFLQSQIINFIHRTHSYVTEFVNQVEKGSIPVKNLILKINIIKMYETVWQNKMSQLLG